MNTLQEQQRRFSKFIFASDDERPNVETLALKQSPTSRFKDSQRMQIYRNNFAISLCEALVGVYPVIQKLVGEAFFQQIAREYVQRYPSRTGNLHDFGDEFASFLQVFPNLENVPYLPDVARLEWAYHRVFHSADVNILSLDALATLNGQQMTQLCFQLSTSCVHLASAYPILSIWQANQDGQESMEVSLDEGGIQCVVLRHGAQVEFHPISPGVFALIDALAQQQTFSQACEHALATDANCDVTEALQFLVEQKIVSEFSFY